MEPWRGRRRVLTLPCIFGKEKNQEALMCLEERKKSLEFIQAESKQPGSLIFFGLEVLGTFYSLGMDYEVTALQGPPLHMVLDGVDLGTAGKILTSSF